MKKVWCLVALVCALVLTDVTIGILCAVGVISAIITWLIVALVVGNLLLLYSVYLIFAVLKKLKQKKLNEKRKKDEEDQRTKELLDLYKLFGIPPQYNKDGSIKNFYDLLGITPQYDENGVRVPTIYELMQIFPEFDENGNEIPNVLFMKNHVKKLAAKAVMEKHLHFVRKLSDAEKEDLLLEKALKQKLAVAVAKKDIKTAKKIKEVLVSKKKSKKSGGKAKKSAVLVTVAAKYKKDKDNFTYKNIVSLLDDIFDVFKPIGPASSSKDDKVKVDSSGTKNIVEEPVKAFEPEVEVAYAKPETKVEEKVDKKPVPVVKPPEKKKTEEIKSRTEQGDLSDDSESFFIPQNIKKQITITSEHIVVGSSDNKVENGVNDLNKGSTEIGRG